MSIRGVTILEALLVAFMLSLILSATAFMVRGYSRALVQSSHKDRAMVGAAGAIETVRSDVAAAVSMSVKSGNPRIRLERVDPAQQKRVSPRLSPNVWNPFDSTDLSVIEYSVVQDRLIRTVTPPGGHASSLVLAGDISDFQCSPLGRGRYDVDITFDEANKQTTIKSIVVRRLQQEPNL